MRDGTSTRCNAVVFQGTIWCFSHTNMYQGQKAATHARWICRAGTEYGLCVSFVEAHTGRQVSSEKYMVHVEFVFGRLRVCDFEEKRMRRPGYDDGTDEAKSSVCLDRSYLLFPHQCLEMERCDIRVSAAVAILKQY